jgi:hypothetical protein
LTQFLKAMHDVVEDAGTAWYVPALDLTDATDSARMTALMKLSGQPQDEPDRMDDETAERMELLLDGPLYVFLLIAAADGKVDRKEIDAFARTLAAASRNGAFGELFTLAANRIAQDLGAAFQRATGTISKEDGMAVTLTSLASLLTAMGTNDAVLYKRGLLQLGGQVAKSSGGLFSRVSKSEAAGLKVLQQVFGE